MPLRLYNSLTKKKEIFQSLKDKVVGMYNCGPTVYDFAHVGNLRSFIFADLLRRTLEFNGYTVRQVMNITDVGHLVSDADTGEEKIELAARREGKSAWEVAEFYTAAFLRDIAKLNIKMPHVLPRATAHIKEQVELIRQLERTGYTYRISDGIYFDTSKFPSYGKLAGQKLEEKEAGARVEVNPEKRNPWDFVLWKFSPKDRRRDMEWESPWGKGFPGWHIECSAMSRKYLGQPFDIHTGGIDHLPVHHPNEIAQSEAAYGVPLAHVWMHGGFLTVEGHRMGKSEGNLITLEEIERRGFDPFTYRYLVLSAHYRSPLNFTWESLAAAEAALQSLEGVARAWEKPSGEGTLAFEERFREAVNDDLNVPKALAVLWELIKSNELSSKKAQSLLLFDQVLGLGLERFVGKPLLIPHEVSEMVKQREEARAGKDWTRADIIRQEIKKLGYVVEDSAEGPRLVRKVTGS